MKLDRSVYKQGQRIKPEVEVTLETGKVTTSKNTLTLPGMQVKVEGLMVLLVQEMVYACNLGEEDECRKKEILVVSDQLLPEEVALEIYRNIPKVLKMQKSFWTNTGYCIHDVTGWSWRAEEVQSKPGDQQGFACNWVSP